MEEIDPTELSRALGQIPLFHEIQKVLLTQTGPVNWEIARQIARAVAEAGVSAPAPTDEDHKDIAEACRVAELRLVDRTGLAQPATVTEARLMDRAAWTEANLRGFRPLIDRLAVRLSGQMEGMPVVPVQGFLGALGPFLFGIQVGFLSGYLSRRVLGQYDLGYPLDEPGRLWFVYPNILEVEQELGVDPQQFRLWIALHEVAHHLEFQSLSWTRPYFVGLIERFIDASEIDSSEVADRLRGFADPERLNRLMEHPEDILPMLMTPAQEALVREIQAFMSVLEGYAEWAMDEVGAEMLPDFGKMREGMNRRRAERSSVERLLERFLGLDLKLEQYRAGVRFIRVVDDAGQLARLWEGPANLPTLEEVKEPSKWLSRVAFS
jgi:coenzyme F420 biosynthesis associated uncharacterized protein